MAIESQENTKRSKMYDQHNNDSAGDANNIPVRTICVMMPIKAEVSSIFS